MFLRILVVSVLLALALLGARTLDDFNRVRTFNALDSALEDMLGFTTGWAATLQKKARSLAADERVKGSLTGQTVLDPNALRRALYEFGYMETLSNVYIFSPLLANEVIFPATSRAPDTKVLDALREHHGTGNKSLLRLIRTEAEDLILVATSITNDQTGDLIGQAAFMEPAAKALGQHNEPYFSSLPTHQVVLIDTGTEGGPAIFADVFGKTAPRAMAWPTRFNQVLIKKSSDVVELTEPRILATRPVPNAPGWVVGLSARMADITAQAFNMKIGLFLLCGVGSLLVLLWPYRRKIMAHINPGSGTRAAGGGTGSSATRQTHVTKTTTVQHTTYVDYRKIYEARQRERTMAGDVPSAVDRRRRQAIKRTKTPERKLGDLIESSLRAKRTRLMFQPIIDSATNKPVMCEVFLRILDMQKETITPDRFLPIAQRYRLFSKIDAHVLGRVMEEYLSANGDIQLPLAVNLGGDTFENIAFLQNLVKKIDPAWSHKIIMELRSQEIISDARAMDFIRKCRETGCRFSTDYFGGGSAMLKGAKRMRFDFIKLNAPDFATPEQKKELITLAQAAQELELSLILERVEDEAMATFAKKAGIPYLQGYFFAKPADDLLWGPDGDLDTPLNPQIHNADS